MLQICSHGHKQRRVEIHIFSVRKGNSSVSYSTTEEIKLGLVFHLGHFIEQKLVCKIKYSYAH